METIHRAYDAKTNLLRPEVIAGAPSMVLTAAARAQAILDAGWRVLGDPVSRERYDEAAGLRHSGGGLTQDASFPSYPGWESSDSGFVPGDAGAGVLGGLMALADWLAPHPREPRRTEVPDIRGLFYSAGQAIAGRLDLRVTVIRLTEHPMPVDGLVVGQSPRPAAKARRASELTLQVWHPPVRPTK